MRTVRYWIVSHSRGMEIFYTAVEWLFVKLDPVWRAIGYRRMERPMARIEKVIKGFLFDCQMCGQCVLSETGMSCPMNCPKTLRNGPCGGVRANGNCEVVADMRCVWVEAARGARNMKNHQLIDTIQLPVESNLRGLSTMMKVARQKAEQQRAIKQEASSGDH